MVENNLHHIDWLHAYMITIITPNVNKEVLIPTQQRMRQIKI